MTCPADRAWLTLAAAVAAWDVCAEETLSAAVSRYHARWPWPTRLAVTYLGAHLLGWLPSSIDVFRLLGWAVWHSQAPKVAGRSSGTSHREPSAGTWPYLRAPAP